MASGFGGPAGFCIVEGAGAERRVGRSVAQVGAAQVGLA